MNFLVRLSLLPLSLSLSLSPTLKCLQRRHFSSTQRDDESSENFEYFSFPSCSVLQFHHTEMAGKLSHLKNHLNASQGLVSSFTATYDLRRERKEGTEQKCGKQEKNFHEGSSTLILVSSQKRSVIPLLIHNSATLSIVYKKEREKITILFFPNKLMHYSPILREHFGCPLQHEDTDWR